MNKPSPLDDAHVLLADDLTLFRAALTAAIEPMRDYLSDVEYELYNRGKKLRPLLLLMAARAVSTLPATEPMPSRVYKAAASLEMLHVATLIHDDIVDRAPKRRGLPSVNAARGPDIALLVGDLQFVNAVKCFAGAIDAQEDMYLVEMVLDAGSRICCGEIDELTTDPTWSPTRLKNRYIKTIDRKTSVLFQLACESGAALMRGRKRHVMRLGRYGRLLGRAFQIMDDLADFTVNSVSEGKEPGADVRMRRLTLPIIKAMEERGPESHIARVIRGELDGEAAIAKAIEEVIGSASFFETYGDARRYAREGAECLETVPETPVRGLMADLIAYTVNRGGVAQQG
ncbi:MAG: polyprenyl synthetase family protein [Alphaproteobacteria bacterium]|nr:polyprenyl synthetase family protein [Alphaproteobacteria bacterium]